MKCSLPDSTLNRLHLVTGCLWLLYGFMDCRAFGADTLFPSVSEQAATTVQNEVTAGWILVNDLGCYQCHQGKPEQLDALPAFDAPHLERVGSRLDKNYVAEWLKHPHQEQPGTRMPSLLHGLPTDQLAQITGELTDFLWQQDKIPQAPKHVTSGHAQEGETGFKSLGCAACHAPLDATQTDKHPLTHVREKYTTAGLLSFLLNPQEVRSGLRMPNFHLTTQEASDLTAYLTSGTLRLSSPISSPTSSIKAGSHWFETLRCHQCHAMKENSPPSIPDQAKLLKESLHSGCLSDKPKPGIPWYDLTSQQRDQIRMALNHSFSKSGTPSPLKVEAYMKSLQCDACHARGVLSGPAEAQKAYFTTTGEDLEDEGRFPPRLDGVGRKMNLNALNQTIQGNLPSRPYMNTRMPDFGAAHANYLTDLLARTDSDPNEQPTPRDGQENQVGRNMWGRALVGINGLGCIQCHPLNGHPSLGIQAMDLKHAATRLRAPWFRDYLLDPAAFRPGTRMPAFWPEGKPSIHGHGGSTERQIDSIWAYLNELDQSRLPEGMEQKGDFRLIPEEKPIVFRTFMEQAGLHAIAVGFPESFHVAFDANACRWSLAWKGEFLSAESTWDDRFAPLASPLGEPLEWFPHADAVWSFSSGKEVSKNLSGLFRGYRLDADGIPTFFYQIGNSITIQDRIQAVDRGIRRQIQWQSDATDMKLLINPRASLVKHSNKRYQIADSWDVAILQGIPEIRGPSNQSDLWLKPVPENGLFRLEYQIEERKP